MVMGLAKGRHQRHYTFMNACARCGLAHPANRPCPVTHVLPSADTAPLPIGTVVGGRFRIEQVAHCSGMSTVYQAVDQRNQGALVALKEFNAAGLPVEERREALTWLAREAGMLSSLQDPRLPKLLAAAAEGHRHFIAMPFIRGETLEARIRREGPQPETQVLSWGRELASLLRYLHSQDPPVVHRDLKPANVLLRPDGSLIVLDLGVARPLARGVVGTAVGTPGYAPPEQYQGLADERSDLYALGATLHRAITGYDPEREEPFRHPPVQDLQPDVSKETARLIEGLLDVAPVRRPDGAVTLLHTLGDAMFGAFGRAYQPVHRMYRQMLLLISLAVALGVAIDAWAFGLPVGGHAGQEYMQAEPLQDALRVLLIFAPGLLMFLPLLQRDLRLLARRHAAPRLHRSRACRLLAIVWGVPLIVWLLDIYNQRQGNLVAVPGRAPAAFGLALGAAVLAIAGLLAMRHDLQRLQMRTVRLRGRYLAAGALVALWPISLAMQPPAFAGTCYTAINQSESQSQFSNVRGLATDARGNLYILDQYGLRERTSDDIYHTLLDFTEPKSPLYTTLSVSVMAVNEAGTIVLGAQNDRHVYRLLGPGQLSNPIAVPALYGGIALGPNRMLYISMPRQHLIYALHLDRPGRLTSIEVRDIPAGWAPDSIAVDAHGAVFVVDDARHAIERIATDGSISVIAHPDPDQSGSTNPITITIDNAGTIYAAIGAMAEQMFTGLSRIDGIVQLPMQNGMSLTNVYAVAGWGAMAYAANGSGLEAIVEDRGDPVPSPLGGTDPPDLHCDLPAMS